MRWPSNTMIDSLRPLINFTVFQSTRENDLWSKIGGVQDDVFVYDRCGLLAYYVPFPHSDVSHRYVEAAIMSAHFDSPCQCLPTPSSASSNCTNSTEDHRNSPVGQVSGSRQVQTPIPSVQSQRQARTPHNHHHRPSRHSTTTVLPPECARVSVRDFCSNNTTHHQRSLTPLQQRCCHRRHNHNHRAHHRSPASRCLCLAKEVDGSGGEQGCLCRPEDGATVGRSCFCRLEESTVEADCGCEETDYPGNGRQCSCTLPRDHVTRECA